MGVLICPSEVEASARLRSDGTQLGISNYGFVQGEWFVWGGFTGPQTHRSAFGPNQSRRWAGFRDGLSQTLLMSEGKSFQNDYRDCPVLAHINDPNNIPSPDADPYTVAPEYLGGCTLKLGEGRTEWYESGAHHNGITTAWTPNTQIPGGPNLIYSDLDLTSSREKLGRPTFAAATARSYHAGGVNALFGDGTVRFLNDSIEGRVWRGLGTVAGGEIISADDD